MKAELVSLSSIRWSVQAIIYSHNITVYIRESAVNGVLHKKVHEEGDNVAQHHNEQRSLILVYQDYFKRLLKWPKPLRNQLMVELPTLEGLRSGEVVTIDVEDVDFEHGDLMVLDSKTKKRVPIPLDPVVADHFSKLFAELKLTSGLAFKRFGKLGRKSKHITLNEVTVETVWKKCCSECGIPYMSPRYGRAYFAVNWSMGPHKKSMKGLQAVLRHDNIQSTEHYLNRIVDYPAVKNEFYEGLQSPFKTECSRSKNCPLSAPDCHCRMFTPNLETEVHE